MRVGVDGSNLRQGGGVTHLVQLLGAADPPSAGIRLVTVGGGRPLLAELPDRPFRWLYVSAIHGYKHPWNVAEAAARLSREGWTLQLAIVGPPYGPAMARLVSTLARVDPEGQVVRLTPGRPYAELAALYAGADAFVFASTCENMPNSLLEAMAAGLPIVCSDRAPMPDLLGEGGVYCNSHVPDSIADAMRRVMLEPDLRTRLASVANHRGREYDWTKCARQTFEFLAEIRHRAVTPVGRA